MVITQDENVHLVSICLNSLVTLMYVSPTLFCTFLVFYAFVNVLDTFSCHKTMLYGGGGVAASHRVSLLFKMAMTAVAASHRVEPALSLLCR